MSNENIQSSPIFNSVFPQKADIVALSIDTLSPISIL